MITSFTCFIKLDITKRKNYKSNEELSRICRTILVGSIDVRYILEKIFFRTDNKGFNDDEQELEIDKRRRNLYTEKKINFTIPLKADFEKKKFLLNMNSWKQKVLNF